MVAKPSKGNFKGKSSAAGAVSAAARRKQEKFKDDDEVENYIKKKHLEEDSDEDAFNDDHDDDSEEEGVMDLSDSDDGEYEDEDDYDDEDDDDDDDDAEAGRSDDDDEEDVVPMGPQTWGKKRSAFYNADNVDIEIEEDSDDARVEEEEARKMQAARSRKLRMEDFGDDVVMGDEDAAKDKKKGKKAKDSDAKLQKQLAADLAAISASVGGVSIENVKKDVSKLSKDEKKALLLNDSPELLVLVEQFQQNMENIKSKLVPAIEKIKSGGLPMTKGLSYLQAKLQLVLSYCMHITFYLLLKAEGKSIKNHPVIDSLVEIRALLEKLRPLDSKLRYQIEKLLKVSSTSGTEGAESANPLRFRSNLANLDDDDEDEEEEEEEDSDFDSKKKGKKGKKGGKKGEDDDEEFAPSGVYRPPKINPVAMDEDLDNKARRREAKRLEKVKGSEMVRALREEFGDEPEEYANIGSARDTELDAINAARERHEEEHFVRVSLSKKERNRLKRAQGPQTLRAFEDFDDFGDIDYLAEKGINGSDAGDGLLQRKSLSDYVANATKGAKSSKAKDRSADEDLPVRDRRKIIEHVERAKAKRRAQDGDDDDEGSDDDRSRKHQQAPAKKK